MNGINVDSVREALVQRDVSTEAIDRHLDGIRNCRDTPEVVNALKQWLRAKHLFCMDTSAENTGMDCFYVAVKHAVVHAVRDSLRENEVVLIRSFSEMSVEKRRADVVETSQHVWGHPQHPSNAVLKVL